jgi:hypothetical protein
MQIGDHDALARLLVAIRERGWRNFTRQDDHDQVQALGLPPWHCWPSWAFQPTPPADQPKHSACAKSWGAAHQMRLRLEKLARGQS